MKIFLLLCFSLLFIVLLLFGCANVDNHTVDKGNLTLSQTTYAGAVGSTFVLSATTTPANQKVLWSSSNPAVAQVSDTSGSSTTITALKDGTATITATVEGTNITATCFVTYTAGIFLDRSSYELFQSSTFTLTAIQNPSGSATRFNSTNPSVANVDPVSGLVTGLSVGTTDITATYQVGENTYTSSPCVVSVLDSPTINITPQSKTLYVGDVFALTADTVPANRFTINWSATNIGGGETPVVEIDQNGIVTAKVQGNSLIAALFTAQGQPYGATGTITVENPSLTLSTATTPMYIGDTQTVTATHNTPTGGVVTFNNSNTNAVSIDQNGNITALATTGMNPASISATYVYNGTPYTSNSNVISVLTPSISITGATHSMNYNKTTTVTATPVPLAGATNITYYSSNPDVATVNSSGLVTSKSIDGSTNITASFTYKGSTYTTATPWAIQVNNLPTITANNIEYVGTKVVATFDYTPTTLTHDDFLASTNLPSSLYSGLEWTASNGVATVTFQPLQGTQGYGVTLMNSSLISCTQNIGAYFIGNFFPTPSEHGLNVPLTYSFTSTNYDLRASELEVIVTAGPYPGFDNNPPYDYTVSSITKTGDTFSFIFTPKSPFSQYLITVRNKSVTSLTSPTSTISLRF